MGDGKAKFFLGNEFYTMCVEDERQRAEGEAEAAERKGQQESHVAALVVSPPVWGRTLD